MGTQPQSPEGTRTSSPAGANDTKYLFKRDQTWWVKVAVPRTLRDMLGYDLRRSLRTTGLETARQLRDPVVDELRNKIKEARVQKESEKSCTTTSWSSGYEIVARSPGVNAS